MKGINRLTRVLVDFYPGYPPVPAFFLLDGNRFKVDKVISQTDMRKTFNRCVLYKCRSAEKIVELRWDKDKDRWFIEKIGE